MDSSSSRSAWAGAQTFDELCELGARFIEGSLSAFPGWGGTSTDEETDRQGELLARVNRSGFLTVASQVGTPDQAGADGRLERRRAFVAGFARGPLAAHLALLEEVGLVVSRHLAWQEGGDSMAVAERGNEAFLLAGHGAGPEELEIFADWIPGPALEELAHSRFLWIVDPEWGRENHLWQELERSIGTAPHPPRRV